MEKGRLTKADVGVFYGTPWCGDVADGVGVNFIYGKERLREEVWRRTSYLGRLRGGEGSPHLLDSLSLTADEGDLFAGYLRMAASDVWDVVSGFAESRLSVCEASEAVRVNELPPYERGVERFEVSLSSSRDSALLRVVCDDTWNGFPYDEQAVEVMGSWEIVYVTEYEAGGVRFEDERSLVLDMALGKLKDGEGNDFTGSVIYLKPDLSPAGALTGPETLTGVRRVSLTGARVYLRTPRVIRAGALLEYVSLAGVSRFYRVLRDTDENGDVGDASLFEALRADPREHVMFDFRLPPGVGEGVFPAADTALWEALVNGVIYRWLLLSYPSEAEVYRGLFAGWLEKLRGRLHRRRGMSDVRTVPRVY